MRKVVPALAAVFIATLSAGSAAKAAVINFSAAAFCPASCTGISYTGATLGQSSAIDLDGSTWEVEVLKLGDMSGLKVGDPLMGLTSAAYGAISGPGLDIRLPMPIVRTCRALRLSNASFWSSPWLLAAPHYDQRSRSVVNALF
jgi:hypothetical protein